jgi:DNA-binding MarR family transcriptional regulator
LLERGRKADEGSTRAFKLEDHLFFYFSQILARRTRTINAQLRPYGLDYSRWRMLAVLQEHSGATMGQLADLTSVDLISLTPKGRRMFARILPLTLAETDRALTGFSAVEIGALRDRLKRIADNLTA